MEKVKVWKDRIVIPTYEIGEQEKYPVFLEKRVYQASSGKVYPHPVIESIKKEKTDKEWNVVYIENDYIKLMVLPALGGRIQMAFDKIRNRHFVYYNHVIKPALVGLTGPWISGGIEFNWPQHHRPSTYQPTDYYIEKNEDGSATIWVSEVERMFRTKGMAGFTLYPDKAYLEIKAQLYNKTPHPQTFLWWANPAVAVNSHYQSVFPPDVNAVFDHGKRDVSEFPIAKGEYYKVDYSPGTDISRYKNIPVPTSYMAITSKYDFVGGYENDSKGGLLHVADHNVSPGKKQWTWGNGDFGQAWDRNLTDKDGPYIELMCGVYTDNQPDFSWMQPYEEKSFKQYFMPYYNVGVVKNATKEALLNLEMEEQNVRLKFYVTSDYANCKILLKSKSKTIFETTVSLTPKDGFDRLINIENEKFQTLEAFLYDRHDKLLVAWSPSYDEPTEIPSPATAAEEPEDIDTVEDLYLNGLHLEQYRHATYSPTDYYLEALKRAPGDVRNNNAMGLYNLRNGKFETALTYFDKAIKTLTKRNPNPYDGEPYFNKGITLRCLGRKEEAYASFYKSCWNAAWQGAGYFNIAQINLSNGHLHKALEHIDKALVNNWHNHKARHLRIIILRKLNRQNEALAYIKASLEIDHFNFGAHYEKTIISKNQEDLKFFKELIRGNDQTYIEYALDYAQAGEFSSAIGLLSIKANEQAQWYPLIGYFIGHFYQRIGDTNTAKTWYDKAQKMPTDYCFPHRLEELIALQTASQLNPNDARAHYYAGNFWYDKKQYEDAKNNWETSLKLDDTNPICWRNLSLLYFNKLNQKERARQHLEKAFSIDSDNARLLMELDQLYKKINASIEDRFELLETNLQLTMSRDDLYLELITLNNFKGNYKEALKLIQQRHFTPWEGGEGKVSFQYITTHIELAKIALSNGDATQAIEHLDAARTYPHNLGEGKLFGCQENDIFYWLGCAYDELSDQDQAKAYWEKAAEGLSDPSPAIFYNDQQPDKIFYQGLALLKLGRKDEANTRFTNLLNYGQKHSDDDVKLDYFAISLPDLLIWEEDLKVRNQIHCHYLMGLGNLGLKNITEAEKSFEMVKAFDRYHLSSNLHFNMAKNIQISTINTK